MGVGAGGLDSPLDAYPLMQTTSPLDADPPTPRCRPPRPGHVNCDACWEANHPPTRGQNDRQV